jgi:hypothetical protein
MLKSELLRAIQQEIQRHDFSHFVENPPSIAQGGKGVVVPGCPACKKRINTMSQFLDHLADDPSTCTVKSAVNQTTFPGYLTKSQT